MRYSTCVVDLLCEFSIIIYYTIKLLDIYIFVHICIGYKNIVCDTMKLKIETERKKQK